MLKDKKTANSGKNRSISNKNRKTNETTSFVKRIRSKSDKRLNMPDKDIPAYALLYYCQIFSEKPPI
ncbi:hypothetical protein WR25_09089 [Diploscapter pachys]|uniref:Uncharacterized protein n=1 Tax=Diploscapter pachys TaxID=2018661 RepID=A0A2A2JMV1_9BILA|nr:hypothetical protein WR25_09089 [Diploscapter pachys]